MDKPWRGWARLGQAWHGPARRATHKAVSRHRIERRQHTRGTAADREPAMAKAQAEAANIVIPQQQYGTLPCWVVGTTPFVCNRQSEKVKRELLFPSGRKDAASRAQTLKHNPLDEYRNSPY